MYQNGTDCEQKAIIEYIRSFNVLLSHLGFTLNYDISSLEIPTEEKTKVDRFKYMCAVGDSDEVKEIKDILGSLLDKIEDAHGQMGTKEVYLAEKQKFEQ